MTGAVTGVPPPARSTVTTTNRQTVVTAIVVGNAAKADYVTPAIVTTITIVMSATIALGGAARTQLTVTTSHPRVTTTDSRAVPLTMFLLMRRLPFP